MVQQFSRRAVLAAVAGVATGLQQRPLLAAGGAPSLPIGWPDRPAGDGFRIGHGFQCENTWYLPGYWHCGEDWYAIGQNAAGALVYALHGGEVVFVGSDYPGRVVIVRHASDLYSMYGHLAYSVPVRVGDEVGPGDVLGTVLNRTDGRAPSHLHYEVRTFLTTADVNGPNPRYGFGCGPNCPPGPGYWPKSAPDLPVDQGWRNPIHVYGWLLANWYSSREGVIAIDIPDGSIVPVWTGPPDQSDRELVTDMTLSTGEEPAILGVEPGRMSTRRTSAESYDLWFQVEDDWGSPWIPMTFASMTESDSAGRPSSVGLYFSVQAG
jgi:hypothetical protein